MEKREIKRQSYPTDKQWAEIKPLFVGMRNRKWEKRELVNAVLYLVKTGCQWRQLPHDFPNWKTVYSFFRRAAKNGLWKKIMNHLVEVTRKGTAPKDAVIDSQSVKTVSASECTGFDGGKKRKDANDIL